MEAARRGCALHLVWPRFDVPDQRPHGLLRPRRDHRLQCLSVPSFSAHTLPRAERFRVLGRRSHASYIWLEERVRPSLPTTDGTTSGSATAATAATAALDKSADPRHNGGNSRAERFRVILGLSTASPTASSAFASTANDASAHADAAGRDACRGDTDACRRRCDRVRRHDRALPLPEAAQSLAPCACSRKLSRQSPNGPSAPLSPDWWATRRYALMHPVDSSRTSVYRRGIQYRDCRCHRASTSK